MAESQKSSLPTLDTDYYLNNFHTLLTFVDELYGDILTEAEQAFSWTFQALPADARRLYVRLISRKGPHFRPEKLHYPEIGDLHEAACRLEDAGLLACNPVLPVEDFLGLMTRDELRAALGAWPAEPPPVPASLRRDALCDLLRTHLTETDTAAAFYRDHAVWTPLGAAHLRVYRLLFFGNLRQDLTEFVLEDLGLTVYESYAINRADRLFDNRALVDHTLAWLEVRDQAWTAAQARDTESLVQLCGVLPDTDGDPSLIRRRGRLLNECARMLERDQRLDEALAFYVRAHEPPARERRARIYAKQGAWRESYDLCREILADPLDPDEQEFAESFAPKTARKLGLDHPKPARVVHPREDLVLVRRADRTVEAAVLDHYAGRGIDGFWSENHLWQSLFGLLFWDIVFAPVRGVFFNRFQRGPKDLFSAAFAHNRAEAVAQRLAEVAAGEGIAARARAVYAAKYGIANHLVPWRICDPDRVVRVIEAMPPAHLAAVLGRLIRRPGSRRSGLPDLFLFDGPHGYRLAEVKGPGDQLQRNQSRWLAWFSDVGVPYALVRVRWAADEA